MKHRKYSKHKKRDMRIYSPTHINSGGVIDYKLPICDFMDNVLSKKPYSISVLTENSDGTKYYYEYDFDGEYISYTKYIISNAKLKEIEKYTGNRLVKEFTDGNSIRLNLYDDDSLITTILAYSNKYLPYNL